MPCCYGGGGVPGAEGGMVCVATLLDPTRRPDVYSALSINPASKYIPYIYTLSYTHTHVYIYLHAML